MPDMAHIELHMLLDAFRGNRQLEHGLLKVRGWHGCVEDANPSL